MMDGSWKSAFAPMERFGTTRAILLGGGTLLVVLLVLGGTTGTTRSATTTGKTPSAIAVDTSVAAQGDVPVYLQGLGTVQAFYTVTITPRVDGELEKVGFVEGQMVKRGDPPRADRSEALPGGLRPGGGDQGQGRRPVRERPT